VDDEEMKVTKVAKRTERIGRACGLGWNEEELGENE